MTLSESWAWLVDGGESNRSLPSCNPEPITTLPLLDESLASKLLVFQRDPVRWHIRNLRTHNLSIDASFCGIGKTYIYCAVAKALNMRPLILSPRSVIIQTKRVMEDHFKMSYVDVINYEGIKTGKTPHLKRSVDARKSSGHKFEWCLPADCLLIFDEAHNCAGMSSINADMLIQAKKQNIPMMAISATLATSPLKMKALGYVLGLHNLSDFTAFCFDNGCIETRYGLFFPHNENKMLALRGKIFPSKGVRVKPEDVKGLFPETSILVEALSLDKKSELEEVNNSYAEMKKEINSAKAKYGNMQGNYLAIQTKYMKKIELIKSKILIEQAESYAEEGCSVAIFVNYRETLATISLALKSSVIHGDQKPWERQKAIDDFQSDKSKYIVCMIQAGGVGVSLHAVGDKRMRVALISPTFNAVQLKQALGRVHRAGGNTNIQKIVYLAGTCEERAMNNVRAKLNSLSLLNDSDLSDSI
jgi:superfamily II DNA or RNA helicase